MSCNSTSASAGEATHVPLAEQRRLFVARWRSLIGELAS
jgi:hypothetical protein